MGTQQILLIVLGVIIVGVAIAVGISMFSNQAYNSNSQSVASQLTEYSTQILQFWKTPASLGGAGSRVENLTVSRLATFLNMTEADNTTTGENGSYKVVGVSGTVVTLKGLGTELKNGNKPLITTTINVSSDSIGTVVGSGSGF